MEMKKLIFAFVHLHKHNIWMIVYFFDEKIFRHNSIVMTLK